MSIVNIEQGVRRALKAYKIEGGMSEANANLWVNANLAEGLARFNGKLGEKKKRTIDDPSAEDEAFDDLKTWAKS